MSYMEMFGKSVLPSGEDLLQVFQDQSTNVVKFGSKLCWELSVLEVFQSQGLFHPHDLLHNVWQQNFHEYSEYAPTSLLNFPLADHHIGELCQDGDDGEKYPDTTTNKQAIDKHICSSQPSMVQWLSSSIFPFCSFVRGDILPNLHFYFP